MWMRGRDVLRAVGTLLLLSAFAGRATAAPDWTTPATLPFDAQSQPQSAFAAGGVELVVRTEVTMPVDLDNAETRLIVSRRPPGGAFVDEVVLTSTPTALPLGGMIAVAPSGAAVVAFSEGTSNDFNPPPPFRWRAMYRAPDGTWEAPVTLFTDLIPTPMGVSANVVCAVAPDGTAVAGAQHVEQDDVPNDPAPGQMDLRLDVAIRPAGGTWQAAQRLSEANRSVALPPGLAADDAGNFTIAWASRFSEGGTTNSNDDRRTLLVRRKLSGQTFWNAIEDVTGSDITKDAFFAGRGMGVGPDGRAVVAFQYGPGYKLWAASRTDSAHTFSAPVQVVTTGATSAPLAVGVAPDGTGYLLYTYQGTNSGLDNVGLVKQAPGAGWTLETPVSPLGFSSSGGGIGFDGNDAIAVWAINENATMTHLVEATRWPAGAGTPEAFRDIEAPNAGVSVDDVVSDGAGSVVATWAVDFELRRAAWDHGGPTVTGVTVPSPLVAGVPASFSTTLIDLWSPIANATGWDFGDGTAPAGGTTVEHTYASSGPHTITITAADALGNQSVTPVAVDVAECEVLGGLAALQCRCGVGLGIAPCAGVTLPRPLGTRFTAACKGVAAAASAGAGKKARRGAGRAASGFKKGSRVVGGKAGKKLPAACRDSLAALLSTARDNAVALKGEL